VKYDTDAPLLVPATSIELTTGSRDPPGPCVAGEITVLGPIGVALPASKAWRDRAHEKGRARIHRPGIRIDAVCPGTIDTLMVACVAASFVIGHALAVDGGYTTLSAPPNVGVQPCAAQL
jgi:hypothetical protein